MRVISRHLADLVIVRQKVKYMSYETSLSLILIALVLLMACKTHRLFKAWKEIETGLVEIEKGLTKIEKDLKHMKKMAQEIEMK